MEIVWGILMGKGDQWEREVSRTLSLWWTNDEEDDVFWRVRASGARATTRRKQGKNTANQEGDIMAVDERGLPLTRLCVIELKKGYSDCEMLDLLDKQPGKRLPILGQFIKQVSDNCFDERGRLLKNPVLILKRNRKQSLIFLYASLFDGLRTLLDDVDRIQVNTSTTEYHEFTCMRFDDFLEKCGPLSIIDMEKTFNVEK